MLDEHHWLGHHLFGETMRYVAELEDGTWVALSGFGSAALACRARESFIGWSDAQRYRRLRYVTNQQRYCILPAGRRRNLASFVLARTLRRLSGDYQARWGHPVVMVETFVDPARHVGTCYAASGFTPLGQTSGYGRRNGAWVHHGHAKMVFGRMLRRDATRLLTASFDHPALAPTSVVLDLNALDFDGREGLVECLSGVADTRKRRGVRHDQAVVLAIATCATLAGARGVAAIGEYAADLPQEVLARLGARYQPTKGRYVAPHGRTIARALARVEADQLDTVVGSWLFDQVRRGHVAEEQLVLALDGKAMRGALRADGKAVHLFAAMAQGTGVIVAQTQVDEKSNEITAFAPVLKGLDLQGALVTADAMHTQVEHARHLVEDRHADYLFQVKANQPNLLAALRSIPETDWSQEHTTTTRGHGRLDHRHVQVAALPESVTFPHAAQAIRVYRERADLTDSLISDETSYYITSVTPERADPDRLGTHIRGHWGIENKIHWVRDWAYDEDRHQLRAPGTLAQTLATLRNLAISILRLQGATNITATLRWIARDPTRAVTLIGC